jgi:hypothetical protein
VKREYIQVLRAVPAPTAPAISPSGN